LQIVLEALRVSTVQPVTTRLAQCSANIAEGYTFGESPTFTRHLSIAYGSAVETAELLRLAVEAEVMNAELIEPLLKRVQRTERLLVGMLKQRRGFSGLAVPVYR
jgi:hypothetical protein